MYCDASLNGLGFWFPCFNAGFWSSVPEDPPKDTIFYFEALLVLSTILHSTSFGSPVSKLVIYTDNMNTVQMFNSLSALPQYNEIIKAAVDHMISDLDNHIQLRVVHISGNLNTVMRLPTVKRCSRQVLVTSSRGFRLYLLLWRVVQNPQWARW